MLDFIDAIPTAYIFVFAGASLGYLAFLARIDRAAARRDRQHSEIDRNAAADLYRLAAYEHQRGRELVGELHNELREVVALYEAREARRATSWERLGIVARNVG